MKFFIPKVDFAALIKPFIKHCLVVDCGCGDGHITDLLNKNQIKCLGVDLCNFSSRPDIIKDDAIKYVFDNKDKPNCQINTIPLVCRPCQGDWYFKIFEKTKMGLIVIKPEHYQRDILKLRRTGLTVNSME